MDGITIMQGWKFYGIREESLEKSSPILGSGGEFDETQLHACCRNLPGEVLTTWRGNFSECNQIKSNYIIHSEGKGEGEDNLWLT